MGAFARLTPAGKKVMPLCAVQQDGAHSPSDMGRVVDHLAIFLGPIVLDGRTGFSVPSRFAVRQDGVTVDKRIERGSWDRPRWY
jgi:hypothetical protein